MCTAVSFSKKTHYFGRNLDLEGSFGEGVVVAPRNLAWKFRLAQTPSPRRAMIGMAIVQNGFPLFYDAVNENGLGMAGLNFPKNASYLRAAEGKCNLAPFEFIPYVLLSCGTLKEARALLQTINLVDLPFGEGLPLTPLHWIISDPTGSLVAEPTAEGLKVYENPVNVLTNNPPFPMQLQRLNDYLNLSPCEPVNRFSENVELSAYSRGMGAIGLPGDSSSPSRFVRAVFARANAVCGDSEEECVSAFFHILQNVAMIRGCVRLKENVYEETVYSSCCNTETGVYYYTTYADQTISAIDMRREDLDGTKPIFYPLRRGPQIVYGN